MRDSSRRRIYALATLAGVAGVAAAWYTFYLPHKESQEVLQQFGPKPDEKLEKILSAYARGIFDSLYEMAQTSARVRENLASRNLTDMLSPKDLASMLLTDETKTALDQILKDKLVDEKVQVSVAEFQVLVETRMNDSPILLKYRQGIEQMFADALEGNIPIVPGLPLPIDITMKSSLDLLDKILREKRRSLDAVFNDKDLMEGSVMEPALGFVPTPEAGAKILSTATEAEIRTLSAHRSRVLASTEPYVLETLMDLNCVDEDDAVVAFKSLIGKYCRESEDFKKERSDLMQRHTEQIMALITAAMGREDEAISHAVRTHPVVKKFGGIDTLMSASVVACPRHEKIVFNANWSEVERLFEWKYSVVVLVTNESVVMGEGDEDEMDWRTKLTNLTITDVKAHLEADSKSDLSSVTFVTMPLHTLDENDHLPDLKGRVQRLATAVAGSDQGIADILPVALLCPSPSDCSFATRDMDELLRRVRSHLPNDPSNPLARPLTAIEGTQPNAFISAFKGSVDDDTLDAIDEVESTMPTSTDTNSGVAASPESSICEGMVTEPATESLDPVET